MGDLLRFLWEKLVDAFPARIVRSYQKALLFSFGKPVCELPTGLWFFLPFFEEIEIIDAQEDVIDLPGQTVTTKDGKAVSLSANVFFRIENVTLLYTQVQAFEENLPRAATAHIASKVRDWTWQELLDSQLELERNLKETLETRARKWGIKILRVSLTDLVQARAYRLVGN